MKLVNMSKQEKRIFVESQIKIAKELEESYKAIFNLLSNTNLDTKYLLYNPYTEDFESELIEAVDKLEAFDIKALADLFDRNKALNEGKNINLLDVKNPVKTYQDHLYNLMDDIVLNNIKIDSELLKLIPDIRTVLLLLVKNNKVRFFEGSKKIEVVENKNHFFKLVGSTMHNIPDYAKTNQNKFLEFIFDFTNILFQYASDTKNILKDIESIDAKVNTDAIFKKYIPEYNLQTNLDVRQGIVGETNALLEDVIIYHDLCDKNISDAVGDIIKTIGLNISPSMNNDIIASYNDLLAGLELYIKYNHDLIKKIMDKVNQAKNSFMTQSQTGVAIMLAENDPMIADFGKLVEIVKLFKNQIDIRREYLSNIYQVLEKFNS